MFKLSFRISFSLKYSNYVIKILNSISTCRQLVCEFREVKNLNYQESYINLPGIFMIRFIFLIAIQIMLSNCSIPGSAFLGPSLTAIKTGSISQTSLAYSGNKLVNKITKEFEYQLSEKNSNKNNNIIYNDPVILNTYVVSKIEISDVIEPEPLP